MNSVQTLKGLLCFFCGFLNRPLYNDRHVEGNVTNALPMIITGGLTN